MNQFEQKKQARIDRYKKYADNATRRSQEHREASDRMASTIPMGQPILVGHHSEKSDRAFRKRIMTLMDKSIEESAKARYWGEAASAAENNTAIYDDDPEAIQKLIARIQQLEAIQQRMKRVNQVYRQYQKTKNDALLKEFDERIQFKIKNYVPAYSWEKNPYPSYLLQNNNANINRLKKRLEQLQNAQKQESNEQVHNNIRIIENTKINRIQLIFPDKPSLEIRKILKSHGFRWAPSEGAWQRHLNSAGRFAVDSVLPLLNK